MPIGTGWIAAPTAAVLYHAINGVKIMVYDFWSKGSRYYKPISIVSHAIFAASMVPIAFFTSIE